jgi:hypothetical protein
MRRIAAVHHKGREGTLRAAFPLTPSRGIGTPAATDKYHMKGGKSSTGKEEKRKEKMENRKDEIRNSEFETRGKRRSVLRGR